jgi:spermidine synthase
MLRRVFFLSFAAAVCAMIYELSLAQLLATLLGGTALRYSTTIGLYLFFMGAGAAFFSRFSPARPMVRLYQIELALAALGSLSPIIVLALEPSLRNTSVGLDVLGYAVIAFIGFLVGMELPLFTAINKGSALRPLAADYLGSFAGGLLFSLYLLPSIGLISAALVAGFLNAIVALVIAVHLPSKRGPASFAALLLLAVLGAALYRGEEFTDLVVHNFYLRE